MVNKKFINKAGLKILPIANKPVKRIIKRIKGNISRVIYILNLNIKGHKIK